MKLNDDKFELLRYGNNQQLKENTTNTTPTAKTSTATITTTATTPSTVTATQPGGYL